MKNPEDLPDGVPRWTLGDRLRKARTSRSIERAELADDIGCTDRTISNYENDVTRVPKLVVRQYAIRTGVPYEWLSTGEWVHVGDSPPPPTEPNGQPRSNGPSTSGYASMLPLPAAIRRAA